MAGIYDVLDKWGLSESNVDLRIYNKSDLQKIAYDIAFNYVGVHPDHELGRVHTGITDAVRYMESDQNPSSLAIQVLSFEQVWLPDPIYSFLGHDSIDAWSKLPDSGATFFTTSLGPHVSWTNYWKSDRQERTDRLLKSLPPVLKRLNDIRGLVEQGVIYLYPWELLLNKNANKMRDVVVELRSRDIFEGITTRYPQEQYNLGPRLGSIGIQMPHGDPTHGLKPGTKLWIEDKTPVLVCGLLNAMLSETFGASFLPSLAGDRPIHDYIRSGGCDNPEIVRIAKSVTLPKFSEAVWEDIVAIRQHSETLALLREIIKDAASVDEERALESIRARLEECRAKLLEDTSLWKVVQNSSVDFTVSAFGGFIAAEAAGGHLPLTITSSAASAGVSFLWQLYKGTTRKESREARQRVDVLTRIMHKL